MLTAGTAYADDCMAALIKNGVAVVSPRTVLFQCAQNWRRRTFQQVLERGEVSVPDLGQVYFIGPVFLVQEGRRERIFNSVRVGKLRSNLGRCC